MLYPIQRAVRTSNVALMGHYLSEITIPPCANTSANSVVTTVERVALPRRQRKKGYGLLVWDQLAASHEDAKLHARVHFWDKCAAMFLNPSSDINKITAMLVGLDSRTSNSCAVPPIRTAVIFQRNCPERSWRILTLGVSYLNSAKSHSHS